MLTTTHMEKTISQSIPKTKIPYGILALNSKKGNKVKNIS